MNNFDFKTELLLVLNKNTKNVKPCTFSEFESIVTEIISIFIECIEELSYDIKYDYDTSYIANNEYGLLFCFCKKDDNSIGFEIQFVLKKNSENEYVVICINDDIQIITLNSTKRCIEEAFLTLLQTQGIESLFTS